MDLLNLCLTSKYFQYNGKRYKQLHGTAMGSPASVVVAKIVVQNIEEQALATYTRTIPLWLRCVGDTFTAVHKDEIDDFHEHLNRQYVDSCSRNCSAKHRRTSSSDIYANYTSLVALR